MPQYRKAHVLLVSPPTGPLVSCFLRLLHTGSAPLAGAVGAAVWSLAANQHRSKQALKVAGFPQALARARLRSEDSEDTAAVLDAALEILVAE